MAWVAIPNPTGWEYQNAPADPGATKPQHRKLWLLSSNGIRTIGSTSVYTQVRKVGDANDANRGEISKSYWDAH